MPKPKLRMKKVQTIFVLLVIVTVINAQSFNFQWVRQFGGTQEEMPRAMTLDPSGNIITVGSFHGTADFDPGPLTYNLSSTNNPWHAFISKLDAQGNFVWAQNLGGYNCAISANSVVTDTIGNVYVTGQFDGNIDFDPGPGQHYVAGNWSAYVLKLDHLGNLLWVQVKSGANSMDIAVDSGGNSYFTGKLSSSQIFVSKLDSGGNFLWNYQASGISDGYAASIACSTQGNVFITGVFDATIDFDPGPGVFNLFPNTGYDAFILKLNNSGNLIWAKQISGQADEFGQGIAVDNLENCFITGTFRKLTDFDPGPGSYDLIPFGFSDCYILKLDASGSFIWAKHLGSYIGTSYGEAIALDKQANVFITSAFFDRLDRYSTGSIFPPCTTNLYDDAFISMFDSSGNFKWVKQIGGAEHDGGMSLVVDTSGNIFTAGYFRKTSDFDPNPGTYTLTSFGDRDVFIHKMNSCTPQQSITIASSKSVICEGESVTLTALGALTYTWGSGVASNSILINKPTFAFVCGTDNNGCVSSATRVLIAGNCVGIENNEEQLQLKSYPNPTAGDFYVVPGFLFSECLFELHDSKGFNLKKGRLQSSEILKFDFLGQNYAPGIYFLVLIFDGKTMALKVSLQAEK